MWGCRRAFRVMPASTAWVEQLQKLPKIRLQETSAQLDIIALLNLPTQLHALLELTVSSHSRQVNQLALLAQKVNYARI